MRKEGITMIDLTPFFQALIGLLAALVTYKLIPWIKAHTNGQQQQNLYAAARIAVYAAEQLYGAGQGEEKLEYALNALKNAGFKVDASLARQAVEDAVYGLNNGYLTGYPPDGKKDDGKDEAEEETETQQAPGGAD